MRNHTPLPWRNLGEGCRDYEGAEIGTTGKVVAVICIDDPVDATEQERDNAALIVKAVNMHYHLVEMLGQAYTRLVEANEDGWNVGDEMLAEIDNLLKEAS